MASPNNRDKPIFGRVKKPRRTRKQLYALSAAKALASSQVLREETFAANFGRNTSTDATNATSNALTTTSNAPTTASNAPTTTSNAHTTALNAPTTYSNAPALNAIPANIATVRSAAENAATTSGGAAKPSTSAAKPSTSRQNKGRAAEDALTAAIDDYSPEALDANIDFNMLSVFIEENYDTYVTSDQYMQDIQDQDFFNLDLIIPPELAGLPAPGNSRQAAPGSSKQVDPASPGQK